MLSSVLRPVLLASTAAGSSGEPGYATVVITGVSLVFAILVLLTGILYLEGKIFGSIDKRKAEKEQQAQNIAAEKPAAAPPPPTMPAAQVQEGIPPEVVAAITAAVASIEGGRYTLRSVQASQKGRGQWGLAGVISYTEPF